MATWRKTKQGDWVVFAPLAELNKARFETGQITVTSKSGATKTVALDSIGNPFTVNGVEMAYGYPAAENRETRSSGSGNPSRSPGGTCDNCGGRGARYQRTDSSGIPGTVCGRCSRDASYELSFC